MWSGTLSRTSLKDLIFELSRYSLNRMIFGIFLFIIFLALGENDLFSWNFSWFFFMNSTDRSRRHEESKTLRYLYNRVLVYDERLFPLLDRKTDKRQLLYVSGELSYELPTNDLCYTVDSGSYIIAHRLHCIRTDVLNLLWLKCILIRQMTGK